MQHKYMEYWSDLYESYVVILSEYEDTNGVPILRGRVLSEPFDKWHLFRPSELRGEKGGEVLT